MRDKLAIFAIVMLFSVPAATAAWGAKGQSEPSTSQDSSGGFMYPNRDTTPTNANPPVRKVYFNGFTTRSIGFHAEVASSINPNSATLGSEVESWPGRVVALLGVWKDCNDDGFIGYGDGLLFEYRTELLSNPTICRATSVPNPIPTDHVWLPPHNDGTWVREFIPIGPDTRAPNQPDQNSFNIRDSGARMWADWNKPGDLPPDSRCYIFAPASNDPNHPEWGTYHSTGGIIEYTDCFTGFTFTKTWNTVAPDPLSFRDRPEDQSNSSSALNRPNPYGDERGASMATAFDCSRPPIVSQSVGLGTSYRVAVYNPRVPAVNLNGSPGGTVNETENAIEDCNRSNTQTGNPKVNKGPYSAESPGIANSADGKQQTDFILSFDEGFSTNTVTSVALGRTAPPDGGLQQHDTSGIWTATTVLGEDRNPFVDRDGLDPQPVTYLSYYAFVSPAIISLHGLSLNPTAKTGIYGADNCPTIGAGAPSAKGWKCDPNLWWPGGCAAGYSCGAFIDGVANVDVSVRVGQTFQLRDIDCHDHSITALRNVGVHYGVLTSTACTRP